MTEKSTNRCQTAPFCLRLSPQEREALERAAAGLSLGEYIRQRLFDESLPKRRTRGRFPVKDHQALSQVLAVLGRSNIPNNLNQIARAANSGSLIIGPDVRTALLSACADVAQMRRLLIAALGLEAQ